MSKPRVGYLVQALGILAMFVALVLTVWAFKILREYVQAESAQRVTTIGERCETTRHQSEILTAALGPNNPQSEWFAESYTRCLKSLAKVEARAGIAYKPPPSPKPRSHSPAP